MDYAKADRAVKKAESEYERTLKEAYRVSLDDINRQINDVYAKYAVNGKLSPDIMNVMAVRDKTKITRLEKLMANINEDLNALNRGRPQQLAGHLTNVYGINYKYGTDQIRRLVEGASFETINRDLVYQSAISDLGKIGLENNANAVRLNIRRDITTGIVQGESVQEVSKRIKKSLEMNLNNAVRIARTEGTRITGTARMKVMEEAVAQGIGLRKQWISALDERTRPGHTKDGVGYEIADYDKPFSNGLMYPGDPKGTAEQVINCRCQMITILDDLERPERPDMPSKQPPKPAKVAPTPQKPAPTPKTPAVNKNTPAQPKTAPKASKTVDRPKVSLDNYPDSFKDTPKKRKQFTKFIDDMNKRPDADPDMLRIYNEFGKIENIDKNKIPFQIKFTDKDHALSSSYWYDGRLSDVTLKIPDLTDEIMEGGVRTTAHEMAHTFDFYLRPDPAKYGKYGSEVDDFIDILKKTDDTIGPEMKKIFDDATKLAREAEKAVRDDYNSKLNILKDALNKANDYKARDVIYKQIQELQKDTARLTEYAIRNSMGSVGSVMDIYDALSGGKHLDRGTVLFGHGSRYYKDYSKKAKEIWAQYAPTEIYDPALIKALEKDKPELVAGLRKLKQAILDRIDGVK